MTQEQFTRQHLTQKTGSTIVKTDPQIILDETFEMDENMYSRAPDQMQVSLVDEEEEDSQSERADSEVAVEHAMKFV